MTSRRSFLRGLMGSAALIAVAPAWALAEVHRTVPLPGRYIELVHYYGDCDTGLFEAADDTLQFALNGQQLMFNKQVKIIFEDLYRTTLGGGASQYGPGRDIALRSGPGAIS